MLLIYLAIFASFLNMFLQLPLTRLAAGALTPELTVVALAVSAYSISNMLGNLFAGLVVDRHPKGRVLAGGLGLGALALVTCGMATDVWVLIACLLLNGAALSVVTPAAYALLSQKLPAGDRGPGMARSGVTIGLAALIGPPVAGRLADAVGTGGAYMAIGAVLGLFAVVLAIALFREDAHEAEDVGLGDLWTMAREPALRLAYLSAFALMWANGSLVFALPPHVRALGYPVAMIGGLFSTFALSAILLFLSPLGRWMERQGPRLGLVLGAALQAVGLVLFPRAPGLGAMVATMALYGLGFGMVFSGALVALVRQAPAARRGTAFGVFYAVFSLGATAAPMALAQAVRGGIEPFWIAALVPALFSLGLQLRRRA